MELPWKMNVEVGVIVWAIIITVCILYRKHKREQKAEKELQKLLKTKQKSIEEYQQTEYYKCTHLPYDEMLNDAGKYGEYLLYMELKDCVSQETKFLFNAYIPKHANATTEVDMIMINKNGVFVFEVKNYSGWISGRNNSKQWCESFKNGEQYFFSNPIIQNQQHVNALQKIINNVEYHPMVVFSDDAGLVNVDADTDVIVMSEVLNWISTQQSSNSLTEQQIDEIYAKLYPYTQVSQEVKERHIRQVKQYKEEKQHIEF